jgi:hypothetical protein
MTTQTEIKKFSKEASQILAAINKGKLDLNQVKSFLSRLSLMNEPTARQLRKIQERARIESTIK